MTAKKRKGEGRNGGEILTRARVQEAIFERFIFSGLQVFACVLHGPCRGIVLFFPSASGGSRSLSYSMIITTTERERKREREVERNENTPLTSALDLAQTGAIRNRREKSRRSKVYVKRTERKGEKKDGREQKPRRTENDRRTPGEGIVERSKEKRSTE